MRWLPLAFYPYPTLIGIFRLSLRPSCVGLDVGIGAQFDSTRTAAADVWLNASVEASDWVKKAEAAKLKLTDDSRPAGERYTVRLRPGKLFSIEQ